MSKSKKQESWGDFMVPLMEILSMLVVKLLEGMIALTNFLIQKYIFKEETQDLKKINRSDLKVKKSTDRDSDLGYSVTRKKSIKSEDVDRSHHTIICGASGFGKTSLIDNLMFEDLASGKPIIYIDPKATYSSMQRFIDLCRLNSRPYRVFSHSYKGSESIGLNPFKEGSASQIADRIHKSFEWSEEHYSVLCKSALEQVVRSIKEQGQTPNLSKIILSLKELPEKSFKQSDIQGIIMRLESMKNSDFGDLLDSGSSFRELWDNKECVYIGLPILSNPQGARALGRVFLWDLGQCTQKALALTPDIKDKISPLGVYVDEFSAVVLDDYIDLINKSREARVEFTMAFQSPSDIDKISPNLTKQILESSATWFVLKQRMDEAASLFANSIGTITGKKTTSRFEDGKTMDLGSVREVEEYIVHANVIKSLRVGQSVLLRQNPARVDLVNLKYMNPDVLKENVKSLEKWGAIKGASKKKVGPTLIKESNAQTKLRSSR